jgi:alpha-L-rhamnosidase
MAFLGALLLCFVALSTCSLNDLRTEYSLSPIAIDNASPRFSWQVSDPQTAYRVVVSLGAVATWDSGVVVSSATANVQYAGAAVVSDSDYTWVVASLSSSGTWSNSSVAVFSTALLDQTRDWKGLWIGGSNQLSLNVSLAASPIIRARAYITAVGCYELWINGLRISRGGLNMSQPESYINPGIRLGVLGLPLRATPRRAVINHY